MSDHHLFAGLRMPALVWQTGIPSRTGEKGNSASSSFLWQTHAVFALDSRAETHLFSEMQSKEQEV
jgi:hypothetical protein